MRLVKLWKEGRISYDEALKNADAPNNLQLEIKLSGADGTGPSGGLNLSLEQTEEEIAAAQAEAAPVRIAMEMLTRNGRGRWRLVPVCRPCPSSVTVASSFGGNN